MDDSTRRNLALFPIGIVQRLTDLSARQIRYYEQHELIHPERTEGNQRLFSFNDVERLLEIKDLIDKGLNIAGIKTVISQQGMSPSGEGGVRRKESAELSERELHDLLLQELAERAGQRGGPAMTIQGELSRFFHSN